MEPPSTPYEVRHSSRAKRLQVVVQPGRVEVVVPRWARERHVRRFVEEHLEWIEAKAAALNARAGTLLPARCVSGESVLLRGARAPLSVESHLFPPAIVHVRETLEVRVPFECDEVARERLVRETVSGWLVAQACLDAEGYIACHAPQLGAYPSRVRIKAQKTIWGSCGRDGTLNLNWRLIGAPPAVFEYVVVHELCHLRERNHGARFWRWVGDLLPGYEPHRIWLRGNGLKLG